MFRNEASLPIDRDNRDIPNKSETPDKTFYQNAVNIAVFDSYNYLMLFCWSPKSATTKRYIDLYTFNALLAYYALETRQ